mmetsp:Transcript_13258/g.40857  ORF Transcript_13258/g.40857 Transcript_13258/m.40857 type:complete len:221 (+) Transcript_13258:672-1334(+)
MRRRGRRGRRRRRRRGGEVERREEERQDRRGGEGADQPRQLRRARTKPGAEGIHQHGPERVGRVAERRRGQPLRLREPHDRQARDGAHAQRARRGVEDLGPVEAARAQDRVVSYAFDARRQTQRRADEDERGAAANGRAEPALERAELYLQRRAEDADDRAPVEQQRDGRVVRHGGAVVPARCSRGPTSSTPAVQRRENQPASTRRSTRPHGIVYTSQRK